MYGSWNDSWYEKDKCLEFIEISKVILRLYYFYNFINIVFKNLCNIFVYEIRWEGKKILLNDELKEFIFK